MKRLLITGANGFVGSHAHAAFAATGKYMIIRAGHAKETCDVSLDLADPRSVENAVELARPDCVLHLAAQSFVPAAVEHPLATYDVNVMGTVRLAEALRALGKPVRLLYVSSAEVYGFESRNILPLHERALPRPANPYAASKLAAEVLVNGLRRSGFEAVIARPFNHIGPGQDARFVVAGFASQLAAISAGGKNELSVGNLEAERDFLDVRDVVRAYVALMERGVDGEVYNIASGTPVPIREILRRLITLAGVRVSVIQDPARMRASDIPCFYGDITRIRETAGWRAEISLDESLDAILNAARELATAG